MRIIGIGGTNGSGKDTMALFLAERYDWLFVSVSEILRQEAVKLNLPVEREHLRRTSTDLRREHGHDILINLAVEQYRRLKPPAPGLVISSLRNPGEAKRVHELGGKLVWLDGDPKLRYQRIYSRQRSSEDKKTFEQFLAEEKAEMSHSGDKATLNMSGVKAKADIFIINDSNNIEDFKSSIEKALTGLL